MNINNLQKKIEELPLNEQLFLVESSLKSVEKKMISQIENFDKKHISLFLKLLQYNSKFQNLENFIISFENTIGNKNDEHLFDNKEYTEEFSELKSKYKDVPIAWSATAPNAKDFFGIWSNSDQTLEQIREKAWKRNL